MIPAAAQGTAGIQRASRAAATAARAACCTFVSTGFGFGSVFTFGTCTLGTP
jgi:hypothetical protein